MVDNHEAVDHDEACAQEVRKRWELGCFEEQIIVYATCYTMDEKMYYFMSDNGENAYKFAEQKLKEGIYCLPIVRSAVSQLIPSGKKEELFREMKINTAIQIKQSHGPEIMGIVSKLSPRNNSVGIELLDHLKETISGCFNDEVLQIFSGLVHLTYYAGKNNAF